MAKSVILIEVEVDHHEATRAVPRITQLLDYAADGYGVNSLTYTVKKK